MSTGKQRKLIVSAFNLDAAGTLPTVEGLPLADRIKAAERYFEALEACEGLGAVVARREIEFRLEHPMGAADANGKRWITVRVFDER